LGGTYKDPGWISCSDRTDGVMSGISPVTATNFTKYDGGSNNTNIPPYGCGPDGNGYYNNNTVGSLVWTGVTVTNLSVFYYDGSGTFTITIDSNTPVTITGGNTGTAKKYDFSGLSATAHTVTIQSTGTGVVSILGMYGKNNSIASGLTVSRMGNGASIASDYFNFSLWIQPVAQYLDIDLLFIILGTNDFRLSQGVAEYKSGIVEIISKYRSATPDICICLMSPAQCNATGTPALSEYDKTMREIAVEQNVNFISGYQLFPKVYNSVGGAWADGLHLSPLGAYVLTRAIKKEFFIGG
ncbi:TPA: GDSL family lipase, partial [Escherichia coli]|nr:GDSL family lipase [Escherichia coli]HBD4678316.1 GDSL family lipase [Escherichia coli]HBD4682696.1 GDSL family lipase [Escherichia coli]HBD4691949.1 GDSL family lipase [Escherichia coli]